MQVADGIQDEPVLLRKTIVSNIKFSRCKCLGGMFGPMNMHNKLFYCRYNDEQLEGFLSPQVLMKLFQPLYSHPILKVQRLFSFILYALTFYLIFYTVFAIILIGLGEVTWDWYAFKLQIQAVLYFMILITVGLANQFFFHFQRRLVEDYLNSLNTVKLRQFAGKQQGLCLQVQFSLTLSHLNKKTQCLNRLANHEEQVFIISKTKQVNFTCFLYFCQIIQLFQIFVQLVQFESKRIFRLIFIFVWFRDCLTKILKSTMNPSSKNLTLTSPHPHTHNLVGNYSSHCLAKYIHQQTLTNPTAAKYISSISKYLSDNSLYEC